MKELKIYQSFIDYFGEINQWYLPEGWIDKTYDRRNELVHGGTDFTIDKIIEFANEEQLLSETARNLLEKIIEKEYIKAVRENI